MADLNALTFTSKQDGVITHNISTTNSGKTNRACFTLTGMTFVDLYRNLP
jgi:hypothetical protein